MPFLTLWFIELVEEPVIGKMLRLDFFPRAGNIRDREEFDVRELLFILRQNGLGSRAIEVFGGLAILLGFQTRIAAWVLFAYLIPTSLVFHNFWALQGMERMDNQAHFFKNVAIMGGLLFVATFGAGAYSIDAARLKKA